MERAQENNEMRWFFLVQHIFQSGSNNFDDIH